MTDFQKSGLYIWGGDVKSFDKDGPYIELVTSPNNPDGHTRQPVVNQSDRILIHGLAYYWPHYTPISSPSDHDIMLFTVSKSTGHVGMRIWWALVEEQEVAKRMTKFIELNTIGVSKDSQIRAAKVLKVVSDSTEQENSLELSFFKYSYEIMERRWKQLRAAVEANGLFILPNFLPELCSFFNKETENLPAFVWMKYEKEIEDCQSSLREHNILSKGGKHFGVSQRYVRISMLDTDENFDL